MQDKPLAVVTRTDQGICVGFQIAKDLVTRGFTVLVASRNSGRGEAAARKVGLDGHALRLDVTDQASIVAAAERVRNGFCRPDMLAQSAAISNTNKRAGQCHPPQQRVPRRDAGDLGHQRRRRPVCVPGDASAAAGDAGGAHRQYVERCRLARIWTQPTPTSAYLAASILRPTALNAVTVAMALELESEGISVGAVSSSATKTNLNGHSDVKAGAREDRATGR
jgi:NAD(P)-dependent dehydrogenase (short-subunit alcohol dehydrogenase family)